MLDPRFYLPAADPSSVRETQFPPRYLKYDKVYLNTSNAVFKLKLIKAKSNRICSISQKIGKLTLAKLHVIMC